MGDPSYFVGNWRCYDGVQGTARPTKFRFMARESLPGAHGEYGSGIKVQGGVGLVDLSGFWGQVTWACTRRTRSSPGYQITGLQPYRARERPAMPPDQSLEPLRSMRFVCGRGLLHFGNELQAVRIWKIPLAVGQV